MSLKRLAAQHCGQSSSGCRKMNYQSCMLLSLSFVCVPIQAHRIKNCSPHEVATNAAIPGVLPVCSIAAANEEYRGQGFFAALKIEL